jgi:hypothetical protein
VTDFFLSALITMAMVSGPQYQQSPCLRIGTAFPPIYTETDVVLGMARLQRPYCVQAITPTPPPIIPGKPPCREATCGRPLLPSWLRRALP